jgi:protein TonB
MFKLLRNLKQEQMIGLMFVLMLHGIGLYVLWSYRMIPPPDEAITLMVNLFNPMQDKPNKPQSEPPKPIPKEQEPPKPQQLVAETKEVLPNDQVAAAPPAPVIAPQPMQSAPLQLSGELSVTCPERSQPRYPTLSMRLNEQGHVVLRVELGVDGQISNVTIQTRSGHGRLDEAAVNAVKTWRCKPVMQNGVAVAAVALQPFNFVLE